MNKIKSKLHRAHSTQEANSLSVMLRDSMYLAWPAASFAEDNSSEAKKRLLRQSAAIIDEEGEDDDSE
ncbi:hypothetical protein KP79_PYT01116 [Mizuhopecten yessoensis]|uniref:Uncharacterized protein n=1 Tax=Mizuhopecten yessoensis TaxID=6573 RepID=A0A210QJP0_MIZYE|nr:hypothetical protein KP79_PYT01116 [Mizuhopecten yessoensis]